MIAILFAAALVDPTVQVEALAWMTGRWVEVRDGVTTQEAWLAPAGGKMAGVNQSSREGRPTAVEQMTILDTPYGAVFTATPAGQAPTAFMLQPGPEGEAVFENPEHDFPQRVIYRRCGVDLCARIEGLHEGKTIGRDWRFVRAP